MPVTGITLEEKMMATNLLLKSGVPIQEMNAVRKHLSQVKGYLVPKIQTADHFLGYGSAETISRK